MLEVLTIVAFLVLFDIILTIGLILVLHHDKLELEEIHERFDELSGSINVVAEVLQRLPDILPQFHLNQNPFAPLIEAFAHKMRENMGERSITDPLLRDDSGRFKDGEEGEAESTT